MKKYIITEAQVQRMQQLADAFELGSIQQVIDALKPIEQLSDKAIFEIVNNSAFVEGKYMLPFSFAREIEAHIIGGTP